MSAVDAAYGVADIPALLERIADLERRVARQERPARSSEEGAGRDDRRGEALARLRQSEEKYRVIFENSPIAKVLFDASTFRVLAVNKAAATLYGYAEEQFLKLRASDLKVASDADLVDGVAHARQGLADGEPPKTWHGTKKHRRSDGKAIDVEITAHPITVEGRVSMLATIIDVTDRLFLEEQLRQTQKMEAIGQLAGGVAHDFNNLMSVVLSYTGLALDDLGRDHPSAPDLQEVHQAGERAAELTRHLLAFSRKQILEPTTCDLNVIVEDVDRMLRRLVGEQVRLSTALARELGTVYADAGQIEQVLMNLVLNARDAMPRGGKILIESANVELDAAHVARHPGASPGRHVMLVVSDNGEGMDRETLARIFEPFFTTKPMDKGTGLGLSTALGIVEQSGGHIAVSSEVGKGTTFKIYFPRTDAVVEGRASALPPASRGCETVLVVEDEEPVRRCIRAILLRQGYDVLEAESGGEAFTVSEKHPGPIHLLVTDVIMPLMNGDEVAERLAASRPGMKVLYVSGYAEGAIAHRGVLAPGIAFLPKPFSPDGVARKVREVLRAV